MFFIRRKHSLEDASLFAGMIDYHSHILPGVDDGVPTHSESMRILEEYERLGLKGLYLTPHFMEDYTDNQPATIKRKFDEFKASYTGSIDLYIGGEYMLDYTFWKTLKEGAPLTVGDRRILLEFPFLYRIDNLESYLMQIQRLGYKILLAHPERYLFFKMEDYRKLKFLGIQFQLNLFSLVGLYGRKVKQNAENLLDRDFYSCAGSDIHDYDTFINSIRAKALSEKVLSRLELIKLHSL